jgi:hypothetical protein
LAPYSLPLLFRIEEALAVVPDDGELSNDVICVFAFLLF